MSTSITQNKQVVQQSSISADMHETAKKTPPSDNKIIKSTPLQENTNNTKHVEGFTAIGAKKSPECTNSFREGFQAFAGELKSFGSGKGRSSKNILLAESSISKTISHPPYQAFINSEKNFDGSSTTYQYNTITCLPAYRNLSIEELRLQDYQQGENPSGKTIPILSDKGKIDEKGKYSGEESDREEREEKEEKEVKQEKAENETVAGQDTKIKTSFGKAVESSPKDQETALSMPSTAKEPFSFGNSTKAQDSTFPFTFGSDNSTNPATKKLKFGRATVSKPEAGASSITNGFASFAISSTTASAKEHSIANSTMTSKDHLYACIESMVRSQVKEEVKRLFKEGKLDDELQKIVKEVLIKLIGDAVKKL